MCFFCAISAAVYLAQGPYTLSPAKSSFKKVRIFQKRKRKKPTSSHYGDSLIRVVTHTHTLLLSDTLSFHSKHTHSTHNRERERERLCVYMSWVSDYCFMSLVGEMENVSASICSYYCYHVNMFMGFWTGHQRTKSRSSVAKCFGTVVLYTNLIVYHCFFVLTSVHIQPPVQMIRCNVWKHGRCSLEGCRYGMYVTYMQHTPSL